MSTSSSPTPSISICCPVRTRSSHLSIFLESVRAQSVSPEKMELILVDDTGPEHYQKQIYLLENSSPDCTVYYYQTGLPASVCSPAVALNIACKKATAPRVFFTVTEGVLNQNCLQRHLQFDRDNKQNDNFLALGQIANGNSPSLSPNHSKNTDLSSASFDSRNVSIDRQHIIEVGGFNEKITGMDARPYVDQEIGFRLQEYGIQFSSLEDAVLTIENTDETRSDTENETSAKQTCEREIRRFRNRFKLHLWFSWTGLVPDPFPWSDTTILSDRALQKLDEGSLTSRTF